MSSRNRMKTNEVFKILQIDKNGIRVETKNEEIIVLNAKLPAFARVGDYIRHVEHSFYDVVDKDGEIVWRKDGF